MAANANLSELMVSTMLERSDEVADNVSENNAILATFKRKGRIKPFDGGREMVEAAMLDETTTYQRYWGSELLRIEQAHTLDGASYGLKQAAVTIFITAIEQLMNMGEEAQYDLLDEKREQAMITMKNNVAEDMYSDGSASGGKQIGGLDYLVPSDHDSGVCGGIDRSVVEKWRTYRNNTPLDDTNIVDILDEAWTETQQGANQPNLILMDNQSWRNFTKALRPRERFTTTDGMSQKVNEGWRTLAYQGIPVICDGHIGGNMPQNNVFMLNTNFLKWRPHSRRNFVPINKGRQMLNQDAEAVILGLVGNMVMSGPRYQARLGA